MHLIKRLSFFKSDSASWKAEHEQGKLLRKFGRKGRRKGQLDMPSGIAITKSGDIVVADTENHRIQVFSQDGAFRVKFGERGLEPHQLCYPRGVAMTPDDLVAVSDAANSAVKIFTLNGQLDRYFEHEEMIRMPSGLSITSDGHFVLTDIFKHCVIVLNPQGELSHSFGSYGDGSQQFDHPYYVTTNSNKQIIVSDAGNNAIKIFHFKGRLLRFFQQDDFKLPPDLSCYLGGIASDSDDNTLVVCSGNIYILTKNGRLWEVLTDSDGLTCPKYLTYSTSGRLFVTQVTPDTSEVCTFRYNKDDFRSLNCLGYYAISI